jgi:hypothetical protein
MSSPAYIELHARSAFSFLRGASLPEELAKRSSELALVYELFKGCLRTGSRPTSCSFGAYALKR